MMGDVFATSVFVVASLMSLSALMPAPEAIAPGSNRYPVVVGEIHDGDTFRASVDVGFDLTLRDQPCRLWNFDAWEVDKTRFSDTTPEEIAKGKQAKAALVKMLGDAKNVVVISRKPIREKYGRLLVSVLADGVDVATAMKAQGWERVTNAQ